MSISINGQSSVPPGFRFHPTEEELLNYYLRKKVASEKIDLDVIRDVDLNKLEPWDIQEKCKIGSSSTPQNDWYFFSHKDKKYPTGTRTNRATAAGFWKATGRDKVISTTFKRIGMRKTLVFYKGRAPHGQKSDWIMHEYRLDDHSTPNSSCSIGDQMSSQEDGWVVCRVFKKKSHHKAMSSSPNYSHSSSTTNDFKAQMIHSSNDGALDQILQYMGRSCKQESEATINNNNGVSFMSLQERFMKLPALENPPLALHSPPTHDMDPCYNSELSDWATLDRLVASHLNGQSEVSKQLSCFDVDPGFNLSSTTATNNNNRSVLQDYHGEHAAVDGDGDLWSFTRSASATSISNHVSHVSHASP